MPVTAKLRYLRIAPRKVRLVADLIRGKSVDEAQTILNFTFKKTSLPLFKLLKSAIASAKNDFKLEELNLFISKITVDEGPKYKRWRARSRGQAAEIQKKTSHVTLFLDEIQKKVKKGKVVEKVEKDTEVEKIEKTAEAKIKIREKPKPKREAPRVRFEKGIKRILIIKEF